MYMYIITYYTKKPALTIQINLIYCRKQDGIILLVEGLTFGSTCCAGTVDVGLNPVTIAVLEVDGRGFNETKVNCVTLYFPVLERILVS